ncbi:hypothetical protein [Massilia sp. CCM 8734]|uniref:hypothetical protein n=1 Tax=Massilia sp. CCM 8734 TaxID=2609283 RepID=UPI001423504F|nr:hypothetical protein [Massilia sp. CCM 8734]NHZ96840.1 hypothetical protein [Massilia sp. CCM 8734]
MRIRHILLTASCVLFSEALASDQIRPDSPAHRLEVLIKKGLDATSEDMTASASSANGVLAGRSIFLEANVWTSKSVLNVCFWNGSLPEQIAVAESAARWNGHARLTLSLYSAPGIPRACTDVDSGDIRIALSPIGVEDKYEAGQYRYESWSLIGQQSDFVPYGKPETARYAITMNLPKTAKALEERNLAHLNFTVRHEFGHAFGLMHEFQAGQCADWIDLEKFATDYNISGNDYMLNLEPLPLTAGTRFGRPYGVKGDYDIDSIMQYNFEDKYYILREAKINPCRRVKNVVEPSPGDYKTIAELYGGPFNVRPYSDRRSEWKGMLPGITEFGGQSGRIGVFPGTREWIGAVRETQDAHAHLHAAFAIARKSDPLSAVKLKKILDNVEQLDRLRKGQAIR